MMMLVRLCFLGAFLTGSQLYVYHLHVMYPQIINNIFMSLTICFNYIEHIQYEIKLCLFVCFEIYHLIFQLILLTQVQGFTFWIDMRLFIYNGSIILYISNCYPMFLFMLFLHEYNLFVSLMHNG